jgi:hypothetical protein
MLPLTVSQELFRTPEFINDNVPAFVYLRVHEVGPTLRNTPMLVGERMADVRLLRKNADLRAEPIFRYKTC